MIGAGGFDNTLTNQTLGIGIKPRQIIHPYGMATQVKNWGRRSVSSIYGTFFDANLDDLTPEGRKFVDDFFANKRLASYIENYCHETAQLIRQVIGDNPDIDNDRGKFRFAFSSLKTAESTS